MVVARWCTGAQLCSRASATLGILELSCVASLAPGTLSFATSDGVSVSRSLSVAERFSAPFPGLGAIRLAAPRLAGVCYDHVLVAVNARSDVARAEGPGPGWAVKLRSLDGVVVAEAAAGVDGVAVLGLAGVWAARHAAMEVYGAGGGPLVSKQFPEVLGGDVYTVTRA